MNEKYLDIVKYNNQSALKRAVLSTSWTFGMGCGIVKQLFTRDAEDRATEKGHDFTANPYMVNASIPLTSFTTNVAELVTLPVGPMPDVIGLLSTFSLVADACGYGTGRSFGAFRAGYQHGKIGCVDLNSPKEPEYKI